jgi:hypothetical protein
MANPLNATFFALRKREKSGVLTGATVAYFVIALIVLAAFVALNFQGLGGVMTWYGQLIAASATGAPPNIDPSTLPAGIGTFFLSLIPFLFVFYLLFAAYEAACLRWMIRGETGGLMGLSFGADTWRVYSTYWIWFLLYIGLSIVFTIVMGVAVGVGVGLASSGGGDPAASALPLLLVSLLQYAVMLYFGVRLAPAAAISVGRKKFSFFKAWTVTRGRFWALLGAFLLAVLILIVLEIVLAGIVFAVIGSSVFQMGPNADPSQMFATMFTPQNLIVIGVAYAVLIGLSMLIYLLFFGINARAVIAAAEDGKIEGLSPDTLAKTFE